MVRSNIEKAVDRLLVLYLLHDAFSRRKTEFIQATKLQKLIFLSEWSMIGERNKGFNFSFIKLVHGPYSQELEKDAEKLVQIGLVRSHGLEPTTRAGIVIEDFRDVIERNPSFTRYIDETNSAFAGADLKGLLRVIYAMSWGKGKTIEDLPQRTPMLYPMKSQNAVSEFRITEEEAEDLLMNLHPKDIRILAQAEEDMRTGKMRSDGYPAVVLSK